MPQKNYSSGVLTSSEHYNEDRQIFDSLGVRSVRNLMLGYTSAVEKLEGNPDVSRSEIEDIRYTIANAKRYLKEKGFPSE